MDGYNASFNGRHDRQLAESSNSHPRHSPISEHSQSRQNHHNRQNSTASLSETGTHFKQSHPRPATSPTAPFHHPSKLATSSTLHFDYRSARYPSPPPSTQGTPSSTLPAFAYPSPSSAQRSVRDQAPPNNRRRGDDDSSPPRHPSPLTLHRPTTSSSSAGDSPMITLPPLSTYRPSIPRGPDRHVELSVMQRKPSITQSSRDHPEQAPFRRHTLDSNHVSDPQMISGSRQRTSNYPVQFHHPPGTQQVPLQPPPPPPLGQTKLTSTRYSSPPPLTTPRRDNPPPTLAMPLSPSTSQPPPPISQSPQSPSQPVTPDDPSSITVTIDEGADIALEPLRLGFENVWTQTVQNVRQVMSKMQKDANRLSTAERRKNVNLMRCLVSSSEKLKSQEWTVEELRKENGSLMDKARQNEQLRRENNQKKTVIDTLNQENHGLRRENEELRKKNGEVKEALRRATEFIFQYKEELAKVKADAETFRKCREASVLSANDQTTTMTATDLHREITRLHAEKERERIFNDAVKQLRALTALEDSTSSTRERDSEEVVDRRTGSSSLDVSTSKPTSVVAQARCTIDEQPRLSTPRSSPTQVVSTDNDEDKSKVEIVDVEMDDDNTTIVPPITSKRMSVTTTTTTTAQQDIQLTDESRHFKEEPEPQSDLEIQRQRQRQARRGPTSPSPSQAGSRKSSPVVSKTGMKRDREQYEEGQVDEEDQVVGIDHPAIVGEQNQEASANGSISAKTEAIQTDIDNRSEEGEIVIVEREPKDDMPKRRKGKKVSTDEKQVTSQAEIQVPMTPAFSIATDASPKVLGRWAYYTQYRDSSVPTPTPTRSLVTSTSTQPPPPPVPPPSGMSLLSPSPPQARLPKKLGINHMDLLYKTEKEVMVCRICLSLEQNPDATTAERRKAKANTKKFPLNASWADLINHCQTEHTKACEDMEKLSPSQVAEMKQRMPVASTR